MSCTSESFITLPSISESPYSSDSSRGRRDRSEIKKDLNQSSEPCKESNSCIRACNEMYLRASELDDCYDSREETIKDVLDVFDELENPTRITDLNQLDVDDFKTYLKIGIQSFIDLIDEVEKDEDGDRINDDWEDVYAYGENNAETVLEWICSEDDIQDALKRDIDNIKNELAQVFSQESCEEIGIRFGEDNGINSNCNLIWGGGRCRF